MSCCHRVTVLIALTLAARQAGADNGPSAPHLWKPAADEVYLKEGGERIKTAQPVTCVAVHSDTAYAVVGDTVRIVREGRFQDSPGAPGGVRRMRALDGALWAATDSGAFRMREGSWLRVDDQRSRASANQPSSQSHLPFIDFCLHLGRVYGATRDDIFRFENGRFVNIKPAGGYLSSDSTVVMEDFGQVLADPVTLGPIDRIASYSGTLYLLRPGNIALLNGKILETSVIDWGALPSANTRDMLAQGSRAYVATDRGLGVLRGMAMTTLGGPDGLPYEDTTCLAQGFADDLWIGTARGAIRKVGDDYHYFGAENWLPADNVRDIAVGDRIVYIATDGGLGIIRYEPYTLRKKAAYFERELEEWGFKRLGFVNGLYWAGEKEGWWRGISDNDGGNTAHYLAAMTFKYAATGDEQARQEAVEAFNAMAWLGEITGKSGFIARSIWSVKGDKGERENRGSGGLPAKWYKTADGLWFWKGDTSSDEVDGHFYAVSLFHDLAAKGREKERARDHLAKIASHIIDNGWVLRDMDGKPTRWGRWDPQYLLTPYGQESAGLNGMEAQSFMVTAYALTGDGKYQKGLEQLLKWRYHTFTVRQKVTFPPDSVVPWDDELAFRSYHPLLRYTKDADLRSIYLRSIERHWEIMRMQHVPFFNFIYGALTGNDCEAPQAVQNLREWPLDLVNDTYRNSHRSDLFPQKGYVPYMGGTRAISPRESGAKGGSQSALEYDGGNGGRTVTPPICWLEDYWMGRYYGFIQAPKTSDPALTAISARPFKREGAKPYDGPPRPKVGQE